MRGEVKDKQAGEEAGEDGKAEGRGREKGEVKDRQAGEEAGKTARQREGLWIPGDGESVHAETENDAAAVGRDVHARVEGVYDDGLRVAKVTVVFEFENGREGARER